MSDLATYIGCLRGGAHPAAWIGVVVAQGAIVDGEQPPAWWAAIRWPR